MEEMTIPDLDAIPWEAKKVEGISGIRQADSGI